MNARDYRATARKKLQGKWAMPLVVCLLYGLMAGIATGTAALALVFGGCLAIGLNQAFLDFSRKGSMEIDTLISGFKTNLSERIIASLLVNVYIFLWSLLFVIPGIIKTYAYSMTFYLMADDAKLNANDAMKKSQELMNGKKGKLFLLDLSFIGWYLLGALTFGILYLWIIPYHELARAEFYQSIRPKDTVVDATEFA